MKSKILNLSLILTSLIGYLEWGGIGILNAQRGVLHKEPIKVN